MYFFAGNDFWYISLCLFSAFIIGISEEVKRPLKNSELLRYHDGVPQGCH